MKNKLHSFLQRNFYLDKDFYKIITFFLLVLIISIFLWIMSYMKNKEKQNLSIDVDNNTNIWRISKRIIEPVQEIKIRNLKEKELIKEWKIQVVDITTTSNSGDKDVLLNIKAIVKKNIKKQEEHIDFPNKNKDEILNNKDYLETVWIEKIKKNYGEVMFKQLLSEIRLFNNNQKYVTIKYNPFLLSKEKKDIIDVLVRYLINSSYDNYVSISKYIENNKINFVKFIKLINNSLTDWTTPVFKIQINLNDIKNYLICVKYKNFYWLWLTKQEENKFNKYISNQVRNKKNKIQKKLMEIEQKKWKDDPNYFNLKQTLDSINTDWIKNNIIQKTEQMFNYKKNLVLGDAKYDINKVMTFLYLWYLIDNYYQWYDKYITKVQFWKEIINNLKERCVNKIWTQTRDFLDSILETKDSVK